MSKKVRAKARKRIEAIGSYGRISIEFIEPTPLKEKKKSAKQPLYIKRSE